VLKSSIVMYPNPVEADQMTKTICRQTLSKKDKEKVQSIPRLVCAIQVDKRYVERVIPIYLIIPGVEVKKCR